MSVVELSTQSKRQMAPTQNSLCHQNVLMVENTTSSLTLVYELVLIALELVFISKR